MSDWRLIGIQEPLQTSSMYCTVPCTGASYEFIHVAIRTGIYPENPSTPVVNYLSCGGRCNKVNSRTSSMIGEMKTIKKLRSPSFF